MRVKVIKLELKEVATLLADNVADHFIYLQVFMQNVQVHIVMGASQITVRKIFWSPNLTDTHTQLLSTKL